MVDDRDLETVAKSERRREICDDPVPELHPLLETCRKYDEQRRRLMELGGTVQDLELLAALLHDKVAVAACGNECQVSLDEPDGIKKLLREFAGHVLHVEYRVSDHGFPVYYFCRLYGDSCASSATVVEDLYRSPDYPMPDERFARLMANGNILSFLRLSQYRPEAAEMLNSGKFGRSHSVDAILHTIGCHALGAAWNEGQRVAMLTARHFELPVFWRAVELLCLILHSDLCELRAAAGEVFLHFFHKIYPQPAFETFFSQLKQSEGNRLSRLSAEATMLHQRLRLAFRSFLLTEVQRECHCGKVPLYKLIFGNIDRLDRMRSELTGLENVRQESGKLELESQCIIESVLGKI